MSTRLVPQFLTRAFALHWHAAVVATLAALASTLVVATAMIWLGPCLQASLGLASGIAAGGVLSALGVYVVHLALYYPGMLFVERRSLLGEDGVVDAGRLRAWLGQAWVDYLLHLPSDAYLLAGLATTQGALVGTGVTGPFAGVLLSNLAADAFIVLREPIYWRAAKLIGGRGGKE